MLAGLSSPAFTGWQAFAALEPFGEERADLRAGIIASVIANVNKGKAGRAFTPRDFMPFAKAGPARSSRALSEEIKGELGAYNLTLKSKRSGPNG